MLALILRIYLFHAIKIITHNLYDVRMRARMIVYPFLWSPQTPKRNIAIIDHLNNVYVARAGGYGAQPLAFGKEQCRSDRYSCAAGHVPCI